jgi:NAD(P)-dependent dehydrogenase (short-subunit alcohol dehydrogenase family)
MIQGTLICERNRQLKDSLFTEKQSMEKTVIITGANRGLGLALTKQFISKHWCVVCIVRRDVDANALRALPNCLPIISDITSNSVQLALQDALKDIGSVNVLINNAGIPGKGTRLAETSPDEVLSLIDVHCIGALRVIKAVMPFLAGDGIIINVSSRFGSVSKVSKGELDNLECSYSYRIAKAAQNMLTQCMCRELKDKGIKICSVHPGRLRTELASTTTSTGRDPEEAAERLFTILSEIKHGNIYSLFEDSVEW